VVGLLALGVSLPVWAVALVAIPAVLALAVGYRHPTFRWTGLGLLYVALPCAAFVALRQAGAFGWAAILFVILVVSATDTAAYFGGRSFGGPKLWPHVSPNKTWSGAVSGLLAAMIVGGLFASLLSGAGNALIGALIAAPLSVAAQAGDLLESAVKRRFGVKDSGRIIPGHGGVLDRIDGLFGAATLSWLIAWLGVGGGILILPHDIGVLSGGAP
jgi:phosphatidate cytidylyltransferase